MKKWLVILLAIALAGCGRQEESPAIRVGLCLPSTDVPYAQALGLELERSGCYVNYLEGRQDQSLQNRQVARLVQEDYDLLIYGKNEAVLDEGSKLLFEFYQDPEFYRNQPVIKGAKEFVRKLSQMTEVFVSTSVYPQFMGIRAQRILEERGAIDGSIHRFLLVAQKVE